MLYEQRVNPIPDGGKERFLLHQTSLITNKKTKFYLAL